MNEFKQPYVNLLHEGDFATFDNTMGSIFDRDAVGVAQIAYKVNHIEGFKQIILNHPARNYSLVLKQLIACQDNSMGLWLLEQTPNTTIGKWDITTYADLKSQVNDQLYKAMIERQAQHLEPRLLMVSADYHKREDFAFQAVDLLQHFPLYPDRLDVWEVDFLVKMVTFKSIPLLENLFARCPHKIVAHTLAVEICETLRHPSEYLEILDEVLDRYEPNDKQIKQLNQAILNLTEYRSDDICVVQRLLPYYDPSFKKGEILSSALYLDNEDLFLLLLDATPLEVQKSVLKNITSPSHSYTQPPHLHILQNRIADLEVRMKLHNEVGNGATSKKRVL